MVECETSKHESGLDHVGLWVDGQRQLLKSGTEKVIRAGAERRDQPVPGSKQAVDSARRGAYFGSNAPDGQRLESSFGNCLFAGSEECRGDPLVVFAWSSDA